jgi:small subunit ribosomal protein S2
MRDITLEELLEAGCHFGHQVTRQNPKAREFVFEARDGIHIIDLAKTKSYLDDALSFVKTIAEKPQASLLVVGTKRQAQDIVATEVKRATDAVGETKKTPSEVSGQDSRVEKANIFTVTTKWVGGTLTNSPAMLKNFQKLHDLTKLLASEDARDVYTKKELVLFEREKDKLHYFYSGISDMQKLPDVVFVIDTHTEDLAVREANRMGIPVVGIVDTNADPDVVSNPIPANDDAVGSIELLTSAVMDAWIEGKTGKEPKKTVKGKGETVKEEESKVSKEEQKTDVVETEKSPVKATKKKKTGSVK